MGLFFLISAYFMPTSFDRKGAVQFLKDRSVRFGVPVVVIGLTIGLLSKAGFDMAHLWFVAHLLVYAVLYTGWRVLKLPAVRHWSAEPSDDLWVHTAPCWRHSHRSRLAPGRSLGGGTGRPAG